MAFPRIQFNGHSEEEGVTGTGSNIGTDSAQQMDSSPASILGSDGNEGSTGRVISSGEATMAAEMEQTTAEPYLAAATDAKPMHMMKKYRPPAEKYTSDCGGTIQLDKQQEAQQSEYKVS